ncbi:hypothetical protein [Schaalia canis]|uniref:Uncharacterized protein n=1 Tax=Schaalia canis TaxID=100469 RepID=A0A3P1SBP5_9ACTO|nr:hypothetical protein [Schaalia canis]RRC94479.1 hypothetical protein EII11_10065 [Schaalia canis]
MSWDQALYLVVIAVVVVVGAQWLRQQRRAYESMRLKWAQSRGWTYHGDVDSSLTDAYNFRPFTDSKKGQNIWVTSGNHRGFPFTLGVFQYNARRGDANTLFQHPWAWIECPLNWENIVIVIPRDTHDVRWRSALNCGQLAKVFSPLSQVLSAAPGFTFFIDSGRLGMVSTEYREDQSGAVHQAVDRAVERLGGTVVDNGHIYYDYEQLMMDMLNVLTSARMLIEK